MNFTYFSKYSLLYVLFCFVTLLLSFQIVQCKSSSLPIKRMILTVFPGSFSNNLVIQNLLDYTISHEEEFEYEYHIISHKIDSEFWEQKIKSEKKEISYKLYTYGDSYSYNENFNSAIEEMNNNPTFGFFGFNKAMILNIKHFMESDILDQLKQLQNEYNNKYNEDYFHMIATNVPNFIHKIIYIELNIKLSLYIQPKLLLPIYYQNFELNTAYTPFIGTLYTDEMSFFERLKNSFTLTFIQILFKMFQMYQTQIINSYGYDLDNNIYIYDSFHIIQYPLGLCFPISLPSNFALIGSVISQQAQKINDKNIEEILSKYNKNIYISKDSLTKSNLELKDIIDIFNELKNENIGVILSARKDEISKEEKYKLPENVYITQFIEQNNILGDSRINLFVNNGEYNSVQESVYHGKPMVILGLSLDCFSVTALIKKKKIGEVIVNKDLINKNTIITSLSKVLNNKEYELNALKIGEIMKNMKNPREEFKYWIDFGFKFGYKDLEISLYHKKYSWIIVNGYDIAAIWVIIFVIILHLIKRIYNCIHDCLCGKCENKHKIKNRGKHFKFD